jgi:hypothetical protein
MRKILAKDKALELEEFFLPHLSDPHNGYNNTLACFFGAKVAHEVAENCEPFSEEYTYWMNVKGILKRKMK